MVWQPEIDDLEDRRHLAQQMVGPEGIARQHSRGKLTVRERIAALADPGSFQEIGGLAGSATYDGEKLVQFTPANSITGLCTLDGRKVVLNAGDFTVRGGASDAAVGDKMGFAQRLALEWHLPYIRLLDATGGSVKTFEQIGRTYIPDSYGTYGIERLLCLSPVISAVLGAAAGLPAIDACLAHFNIMVQGISQVFPV